MSLDRSDLILHAPNLWAIAAFVAYLLLIITIGVYATRFSSAGVSEFFIGGRRMNRFVVALSAVVSGRSAWLLLGVTGMAYAMGASAVWAVVGYITVEFFLFLYYAPRLRRFSARYMSIDDPAQLRWSGFVGTFWNAAMALGAILIGLVGRAYFPDVAMLPGADTENLYPLLAQQQLPPVLFGIVVASIFAAIMSTADSQLLVAASAVVRDVYEKVLHQGETLPQRRLVFMSRAVVAILVVLAIGFGMVAEQVVFWLVLFAWAGLGASLGPTSIVALYWKRTTKAGVIAGVVAGTATTVIWYLIPALKSRMYELVPAFFVALLATVAVSLWTRPPDEVEALMEAMVE